MNEVIERYLFELSTFLRVSGPARKGLLAEIRDHLLSASSYYESSGLSPSKAARRAVSDFGDAEEMAEQFDSEEMLTQRSGPMTKAAALVLGAMVGTLMTSFGLIDTQPGGIGLSGGNEWTPVVTGGGTLLGAMLFALPLIRRHLVIPVMAALTLIAAVLLRDRVQLGPIGGFDPAPLAEFSPHRPPSDVQIITLMLGAPSIGALVGLAMDRWVIRPLRSRTLKSPLGSR